MALKRLRNLAVVISLALAQVIAAQPHVALASNPPSPQPTVTTPWLFTGTSYITQLYGCTSLSVEPYPPDARCSGNANGAHWHTGLDIAGGSVVCGTIFRVGQYMKATTVTIAQSFSAIEARLADTNYLVIYHSSAAYVTTGFSYSWGANMGKVGSYGNSTGCHIHFEIDGPRHTVGHFQDWTDINPSPELASVKHAVAGSWLLRNSNTAGAANIAFTFGAAGDVPVVGDWTGSGVTTPGIFRKGTWYLRNSNTTGGGDISFAYGAATDIPIVGDWTGQCKKTPGLFRLGHWYLRNSNTAGPADISFTYGATTDIPVVGDWTGKINPSTGCQIDTPGVFRKGIWYLRNSNTAGASEISFSYGASTDQPVVGNWTGQHGSPTAPVSIDTPGVFRSGTWYLRNSNTAGAADIAFAYGSSSYTPLVGDWTGQTSGYPWYQQFDTPGVVH